MDYPLDSQSFMRSHISKLPFFLQTFVIVDTIWMYQCSKLMEQKIYSIHWFFWKKASFLFEPEVLNFFWELFQNVSIWKRLFFNKFLFSLGIPHDQDEKCRRLSKEQFDDSKVQSNIMAKMLNFHSYPWKWSACSAHFVTEFFE